MVEKDKFLVVVSILEGRNFPKRAGFQLVAEARFDGELLSSDPVTHVDHPEFTQELAWELNKKALHQHRLQRSSIKVQVYAVNTQTSAKEAIGYVVLDLRSATTSQSNGNSPPASKWHLLLHGKYHKTKPELRVGLYVDEDKGPGAEQTSFKAKEAPARAGKGPVNGSSSESSTIDLRVLKPILNEAEGLYQIGPVDKCTEHFVLSVTIAFATNLPQLIPTNIPLPNTGFFFYYSLLGNDVTNESFTDLINPNFPAERASVRARSSVEALRLFFSKQPGLQIHLCCGDQSLGSSEVPLQNLIKKGSTEIYMRPVTLEGAFPLNPPNRLKEQLGTIPEDMKPMVGVSVAIRKEDTTNPGTPRVGSDAPGTHIDEQTQTPRKKSPKEGGKHTPPEKLNKSRSPVKTPQDRASPPRSHSPSPHDGSYTDTFDQSSKTDNNVPSIVKEASPKRVVIQSSPEIVGPSSFSRSSQGGRPTPTLPQHIATFSLEQHPNGAPRPENGTLTHHFCCSIDLHACRNTDMTHPANIFLRYTYAFFGSVAPILTHPPVDLRKGSEVILPQSFCAFDFATTQNQIVDTFRRVPLVIEVWNREAQRSQNILVGTSKVSLTHLLQMERTKAVHNNGSEGYRQTWSERLPIISSEKDSSSKRVGELHLIMNLEDWGALVLPKQPESSSGPTTTSSESSRPVPAVSPRQTQEYKVAMELELWKEQQEALFEEQLQAKEKQYMLALAEEWKRRNKDQELVHQKKVSTYTQMEGQLKATLTDLNKREKQLAANEQEVMRLRGDLQREHDRKMTEMREASRRLTEECEHRISLERNKIRDMEENAMKLKQQLVEAENKYQALNKEFSMYREQQNSKPEVRLQSEINLLTLEKVELERKLEAVTKNKVHYKQQWGRALKELARLKQREQTIAKQELRRQQQELEHMRLRYLAAEEKEVVNEDRQTLEEIKKQFQQMKEDAAKTQQLADMSAATGPTGLLTEAEYGEDEHITRLIEERDTLLRTGVYTTDDRIITELDRQVREAINKHGKMEATSAVLSEYHTKQSCRPQSMLIR